MTKKERVLRLPNKIRIFYQKRRLLNAFFDKKWKFYLEKRLEIIYMIVNNNLMPKMPFFILKK
jgi:hypothetical protein